MAQQKLITLYDPKSPVAEAYRILRTNIQFSSLDKPIKKLLITSAGPQEGKSLTVSNLGVAFAQTGLKVLILDCDLRKPCQHKNFEVLNTKGLTNILLGELSLEDSQDVGIDGLKLITTGPIPPNPSELLGSRRMKEFLDKMSNLFDIVLVDTPPVVAVTDAALMAANMDGVLLVVASGAAKIEMTQRAKELLLNVNARIIGTVLNMIEHEGESYYYYYYGEDGKHKSKHHKKHKKQPSPAGGKDEVPADDKKQLKLTGGEEVGKAPAEERPVIDMALSVHPDFAYQVRDRHENLMKEELAQLPPVKEGDVTIDGAYVVPSGDKVEVGFYIRNGLSRPIRFESIPLVITNLDNEVLARQVFSMSELGEIPPHSARPWEVYFDRDNVFVEHIQHDNWKLAFDLQPKPQGPAGFSLEAPEQLTEEQRKYLENILEKLPQLKPGELNISALQAKVTEDGKLLATVIIRNGGKRPVKLEKLPLAVRDAKGQEVATGTFSIENLEVKPNSARLWTFAFPAETILRKELDLSRWDIYLKNNIA